MRNFICTGLVLAAATIFLSGVSYAQAGSSDAAYDQYVKLLRSDLRGDKKQFIALNMNLTPAEATKFWPLYDQYAGDAAKLYDARIKLIKEYAANYEKLTDATAADLNKRSIDNEEAFTKLRQNYVPLIGKVLPGKKAALFFQIEKRIALLIDLQIASEIPFVIQ